MFIFLLEIYLGVGLLGHMITALACRRVSREGQDLQPGDLLSGYIALVIKNLYRSVSESP